MTKRSPLPRRIAVAFVEHAAWVFPSTRGPWAIAMQHELPEIENDLEALKWAGGCLFASYVERARETLTRQRMKAGLAALLAIAVIGAASWWAGQRPYLTPGNHQVFRQDSNAGFFAEFLVVMAAAIAGVAAAFRGIHRRKYNVAARVSRVCAIIMVPYVAALVLVSLLTPRTVVNVGDSYCYDLWCLGVNQVNTAPSGQNILYTADVHIFVDSTHPHHLPAEQATHFLYVRDDQGRRYPLLKEASFIMGADVTVHPGESVTSSFAFRAPPNARKLYLMANDGGLPPWVYMYFGSDISLFHRRARLRIL